MSVSYNDDQYMNSKNAKWTICTFNNKFRRLKGGTIRPYLHVGLPLVTNNFI